MRVGFGAKARIAWQREGVTAKMNSTLDVSWTLSEEGIHPSRKKSLADLQLD